MLRLPDGLVDAMRLLSSLKRARLSHPRLHGFPACEIPQDLRMSLGAGEWSSRDAVLRLISPTRERGGGDGVVSLTMASRVWLLLALALGGCSSLKAGNGPDDATFDAAGHDGGRLFDAGTPLDAP